MAKKALPGAEAAVDPLLAAACERLGVTVTDVWVDERTGEPAWRVYDNHIVLVLMDGRKLEAPR